MTDLTNEELDALETWCKESYPREAALVLRCIAQARKVAELEAKRDDLRRRYGEIGAKGLDSLRELATTKDKLAAQAALLGECAKLANSVVAGHPCYEFALILLGKLPKPEDER